MKLESSRQRGLDRDVVRRSNSSRPLGPPAVCPDQHRVGREQRREHDDVAEQEDPEPVGDDDALRRQPRRPRASRCPPTRGRCDARPRPERAARLRQPAVMSARLRRWRARPRRAPFGWPGRCCATSSAGMLVPRPGPARRRPRRSRRRRARATPTIHQMCQISAKPVSVAKNAHDEAGRRCCAASRSVRYVGSVAAAAPAGARAA